MGEKLRRRWFQVDRAEVQVLENQLRRQRYHNDCGLAALATVAARYGHTSNVAAWSSELSLRHDGTDLLSLSRLAQRVGFDTALSAHHTTQSQIAACRRSRVGTDGSEVDTSSSSTAGRRAASSSPIQPSASARFLAASSAAARRDTFSCCNPTVELRRRVTRRGLGVDRA